MIVSIMRTLGVFSSDDTIDVEAAIWGELQLDEARPQLELCHDAFAYK